MAMFDYKNYSASDSANLITSSQKIAAYSSLTGVMGLPTHTIMQGIGDIASSTGYYPSKIDLSLPAGWREITPSELKLPASSLDFSGYYHFDSPLTGNFPTGPQAKVLGKFNSNGKLEQVSIGFAGTNSPVDVIDYFQMNEGTIAPNMNPLLVAVAGFASENNLTGQNVLVTGYSLGGAMTNIMARFKDTLADGFFKNSDYVGHDSPTILDDKSILNVGYENDAVYRITGNEANFSDAVNAAKPGLVNPDKMFGSSIDNLVLFDNMYASPIWEISPFSVLNIVPTWYAHVDGTISDALSRIANSSFYEFTARDSTVIVDNLTAIKRPFVWVEDKATHTSDHYNTPAFIIGNKHDNLLKGGIGGDYIDAGAGDDKIKTGFGADRIDGGDGVDTLVLSGSADDWSVYKMSDGTLFFNPNDGTGLKQAHNIEQVQFEDQIMTIANPYTIGENGLVDNSFKLFTWLNHDKNYASATEGSAGNDNLTGKVVFAQGGNDILTASENYSILHGGEGNDILVGKFSDALYGGEGNDLLIAKSGQNQLFGGVGNDTFAFEEKHSDNIIYDFNQYSQDRDSIKFSKQIFSNHQELASATHQEGENVVVRYNDFHLQVQLTTVDEVLQNSSIIA